MTEQQIDRKDLKIQALLEKISKITADYENQESDYRVEITLLAQELNEARERLNSYESETENADVVEEETKPAKKSK